MRSIDRRVVAVVVLLLAAVAGAGCGDVYVNATGGSGTGGSSAGGTVFPTPTPTPTPNPTPTTLDPTGTRTPDPFAGGILPLPQYGAAVTKQVDDANPSLVTTSCVRVYGAAGWNYLTTMLAALRQRDTRWGFHCKVGNCANVSVDTIVYHATAGPEVTGALGGWVVDLIGSECQSPTYQFINQGYDAQAGWSLSHP